MKTVAVVQARMSSSRFPGKMLETVSGMPLAVYVCTRIASAKRVDEVVLATSDDSSDDLLADVVARAGVHVFRGALEDVLSRFAAAAASRAAQVVVRVTGDCPLVDAGLLDVMIEEFAGLDVDYLSNISPPTYPDGLDLEIMRMAALDRACREASSGHEREHVTPFLRSHPELFSQRNFSNPRGNQSKYRWSVDRPEDLALVRALVSASGVESPSYEALLAVLSQHPELEERSRNMRHRNEGAIRTYLADLESRAPRPEISRSEAMYARARDLIPAGTQTLSKGPTQFVRGFSPKYVSHGKGSHVWDLDGNEFIDYPLGLGPVTLGHGHQEVHDAVASQLAQGTAFSWMHPLEVEVAEMVRDRVPCAEMVRFGKNGSDATSACIRASRAITGRTLIARCGYHGWQDWSIDRGYGIRARGVPEEVLDLTVAFPFNDLPALERLLSTRPVAAVILEPVSLFVPNEGYLQGVRDLCTRYGAVLVFDEVISGFRYARGGAQDYFGVTPDLASMGKGVANGLPLSIVAGTRAFMRAFDEIFFSFTFGGDAAALAAAKVTMEVMDRDGYFAHVWRQGAKLQNGYREIAREFALSDVTDCGGLPPWTVCTFQDAAGFGALQLKSLFQQEMIRFGVLFSGSQFVSLAHSDTDIDRTLTAYREAMRTLKFALDCEAVDLMTQGEPIELVFRRAT